MPTTPTADITWRAREEKKLQRKAQKVLKDQMEYVVGSLEDIGFSDTATIPAFNREREKNTLEQNIKEMLGNIPGVNEMTDAILNSMGLASVRGGKTTIQALKLYKFGMSFSLENPRVVELLKQKKTLELSERAGSISHTTKSRIRQILIDGAKSGASYTQMSEQILAQAVEGVFSPARGELIAITEVGRAYGSGQRILCEDFLTRYPEQRLEKRWITVGDGDVRETHKANQDAGWIDFRAKFPGTNEDQAPSEDFRCRCTYEQRIAEDKKSAQGDTVKQRPKELEKVSGDLNALKDKLDVLHREVASEQSLDAKVKEVNKDLSEIADKLRSDVEAKVSEVFARIDAAEIRSSGRDAWLKKQIASGLQVEERTRLIKMMEFEENFRILLDELRDQIRSGIEQNEPTAESVGAVLPKALQPKLIVKKLESLKGKDRLSAKAIKDLSKYVTTVHQSIGGGGGALLQRDSGVLTTLFSGDSIVASDHGTAATDEVVNVCYGTGSPPDASTTTEGALFIKYTA